MKHRSLYLGGTENLFVGAVTDNQAHRHNALQISLALKQNFTLDIDNQHRHLQAVMIAANTPHRLDSHQQPVIVILIDAETHLAKQLSVQLLGNNSHLDISTLLPAHLWQGQRPELNAATAQQLLNQIVNSLLVNTCDSALILDTRITQAIHILTSLSEKQMPLQQLAQSLALSPSRLSHLFKQEMGIPLRRYLLWLRMGDAITLLAQQYSLTEAAHLAGFTDSAHFSKTFKQMFGTTAAAIFKHSPFIQVLTPVRE